MREGRSLGCSIVLTSAENNRRSVALQVSQPATNLPIARLEVEVQDVSKTIPVGLQ